MVQVDICIVLSICTKKEVHSTHVGANDSGLKSVLEVDKLLKMTPSNWKCQVSGSLFVPEFLKMGNCTPILQHIVVTVNDLKDTILVRQGPQLNVWRLCFCHFLSPIYQLNDGMFPSFVPFCIVLVWPDKDKDKYNLLFKDKDKYKLPFMPFCIDQAQPDKDKKDKYKYRGKDKYRLPLSCLSAPPQSSQTRGGAALGTLASHPRLCCSKPFPRFISAFAFVFLFVFVFAFVSAFAIVVLFVFELVSVSTVPVRNGNKVLSKRCTHR